MNVYQRATLALGVAALLISVNMRSVSSAVDGQPFGPILGGLKSVYVQVEPFSRETQDKGLAAAQLLKDTERQLSKAGIKLLSEREFNNFRLTGSYPLARLDVSVTIDQIDVGGTSLNVNLIVVTARQQALLGRKPAIRFFAITWQRQEISYSNDVADVYEVLGGLVNEFISAYNAANR
ncbi:MAG: hypothetical protein JSW56_13345 [Deltaproteobacteria bacterium]|nr:MAG: hypothetical protein JSW56_13345 [Deltaproteobacteria bacterium]